MDGACGLTLIVPYGHYSTQQCGVSPLLPTLPDPCSQLNTAFDRHDSDRRRALAGVTGADLDTDKQIWSAIGVALAEVAQLVADGCQASGLCGGRPATTAICARLVEAIDDQVDVPAWEIIEAAASAVVAAKAA